MFPRVREYQLHHFLSPFSPAHRFHFHSPSEHTINGTGINVPAPSPPTARFPDPPPRNPSPYPHPDSLPCSLTRFPHPRPGVHYPLEMHLVHKLFNASAPTQLLKAAVIGVMFTYE